MSIGEIVFRGIIGLILLYIFVYLPLSRYRIWRQLRSATGPEFQPSEFYVLRGKVGMAIDVVRRRFAVATPSTSVLLEAMDVTDIRIRDNQLGGVIVDVDLRSAVVPTVRFDTVLSSNPLRVSSLLKSFQKDMARENIAGEKNPPRQEFQAPAWSAPGLEQELAALRCEVSKLTAVLTSLGDAARGRRQDKETQAQSDPLYMDSNEQARGGRTDAPKL